MRKILLALTLLMMLNATNAQQLHFMSQYLQHNSMYNPAAAGMSQKDFLGVSYRSMWGDFPGNPKTSVVYGDFELKNLNAGAAAYLYKDETGPTSRTGMQLAYSYHIKAKNEKSRFGIGIELRGMQYAINKAALTESLTSNDPLLMGASNKFVFDAGTGVYWTNNKLTAGFAATQLMASKLKLADVTGSTLDGKLYRHYNLTLNYKIQTGDDIYLIPSIMYRAIQNAPSECDLGVKVDYQDKLWWTLNWRINQFWSVQTGLKLLQRVRATYSYDYYVTPVSIFTNGSGSHEIGLQFDLKKK
jgi:hypothetical protein